MSYVQDSETTIWTYALNVDQRSVLIVHELSSKLGTLVGVQSGDVLKKRGVVGRVVDSLGVDDDFGKLSRLCEARTEGYTPSIPVQIWGGERERGTHTTLLGTLARR